MAEAINQHHSLTHRPSRVAAHGPRTRRGEDSRPNYALRRLMAVGMLGLSSIGVHAVVADTIDRFSGTDIPSADEAREHPENYTVYVVKEGDTRDGIAARFTTDNHDYRNNSYQIKDQMDAAGDSLLTPNDKIIVPTTTTPPELPPEGDS